MAEFDAVCIQHNFAFFGFDAVHCDALVKLQKKAPVFLTLHATRPLMSYDRDRLEVAKRALGSLARLIVHTTADLNILKTVGLVDNVVMIPQGVPERLPLIPASRADFGIPQSAFVVGSFGFLLKHKGIAELVSALPLIRSSTGKDVRFLLVNAFHDEIGGLKEKQRIDALIRSLNIGRWVVWMNEFLPIEQSKSYLAMADLLAFPYQHTFESSSAAVRMAIRATGLS